MAKTAAILIRLVPESVKIDDAKLKKEIAESLNCDWLFNVLDVKVTEDHTNRQA